MFSIAVLSHSPGLVYCHLLLSRDEYVVMHMYIYAIVHANPPYTCTHTNTFVTVQSKGRFMNASTTSVINYKECVCGGGGGVLQHRRRGK